MVRSLRTMLCQGDKGIHEVIIMKIERSAISPQELARMKEEYNLEEVQQQKYLAGYEAGKLEEKRQFAKNLLDVLDIETIALKSGLSVEAIQRLKDEQ